MICAHGKLCVVPYGTLHLVRFVHPTKVGCYNICRAYGSVESSGSLPLCLTAMVRQAGSHLLPMNSVSPHPMPLAWQTQPLSETERGDDSPSPQGEGLGLPAGHSRQAKWKRTTGFYRAVGSANIVTPDFSRVNKAHHLQSAVRHDT